MLNVFGHLMFIHMVTENCNCTTCKLFISQYNQFVIFIYFFNFPVTYVLNYYMYIVSANVDQSCDNLCYQDMSIWVQHYLYQLKLFLLL